MRARATILAAAAWFAAGCSDTNAGARGAAADSARTSVTLPADVRPTPSMPSGFALGHAPPPALVRRWDIDVGADGRNLPPGSGSYARGATLYAQKCASCHGARGEGMGQGPAAFPRLVGREPRDSFVFAQDPKYVKTIGNYWPHATTVFDYVRRAMPLTAPGTLTDDETYSLVAWLLAENEVVGRDVVMDARTLRQVKMPAHDRFVPDNRTGGPGFR